MKNIFKILTLFTLLCTLSVGQLWAGTKRVYCYYGYVDWWDDYGRKMCLHAWGSSTLDAADFEMEATGTANLLYYDLDDSYTSLCFFRSTEVDVSKKDNQTVDITIGSNNRWEIWTDTDYGNQKVAAMRWTPTPAIDGLIDIHNPHNQAFSFTEDDGTYEVTLSAHTTYQFKILDGTTAYGLDNNVWTSSISNYELSTSGWSLRLATAAAGKYTFAYNKSTHKLSVTFPTVSHPSIDYCYLYNYSWSKTYIGVWNSATSIAGTDGAGTEITNTVTINGRSYFYCALGDYANFKWGDSGSNGVDNLTTTEGYGKYQESIDGWAWRKWSFTITLDEQAVCVSAPSDPTVEFNGTALSNAEGTITIPVRTGYNFGGYYNTSACDDLQIIDETGAWQGSKTGYTNADRQWIHEGGTATLYAKWTPADLTFTAGTNSNWSTTANWSPACVPTIDHNVVIAKPVTVDVTTARAKSVVLDQYNGNTGSLTINAGKELVVAETLRKKNASNAIVATDEDDVVFNSDASNGLGALVLGTHDGTNKATVNFYSKSGKDGSGNWVNQYVGTPFGNRPSAISQFYNSWMYKILWNDEGNIYWAEVDSYEGLRSFKGYNIISNTAVGHTYWMQGSLVASRDTIREIYAYDQYPMGPNNENLLANSWMAPIKIAEFEASDFPNAIPTIYIFNSGSQEDYEANGGDLYSHTFVTGDLPGQYSTYPIGSAGTAVIPAMQSFSVFADAGEPGVSFVNLDYSRLVYDPAIAGTTPTANKAPRREKIQLSETEQMYLLVQGKSGAADKLRILTHEDFAEGFENGWDGHKLFGESFAPQLYAMTTDGNMAVNCIPDFEGTVLGFKPGDQDTAYTFYFHYEGEETLYLNDIKEQTSTLINGENSYSFTSAADDAEARFVISATPIKPVITGCENVSAEAASVRKLCISGHICIIRSGRMYDVTGTMVK